MTELKILAVNDNAVVSDILGKALESSGYTVTCLSNGEEALRWLQTHSVDMLVMGWVRNGLSEADLVRILGFKPRVQSNLLAPNENPADKLSGFENDYNDNGVKSLSVSKLVDRIQAVMYQRPNIGQDNFTGIGAFALVNDERQLLIGEHRLNLTPIEYNLLEFFMLNPDKVHNRHELLINVWGPDSNVEERTVDVQIRRLRLRLAEYGLADLIQTVRGLGYRLSMMQKTH